MAIKHTLNEIIQVAQIIRAYLALSDYSDKPPLSKGAVNLACSLIGRVTDGYKWTGNPVAISRRLKSAGIDPETFSIVDKKRAAWAWHQLKTTRKYSEKKQIELMDSINEIPDINDVLIYSSITPIKSQKPEIKAVTHTEKRFKGNIQDLFE